jgi:hypothetical protein
VRAVRQRFYLAPCAKKRSQLCDRFLQSHQQKRINLLALKSRQKMLGLHYRRFAKGAIDLIRIYVRPQAKNRPFTTPVGKVGLSARTCLGLAMARFLLARWDRMHSGSNQGRAGRQMLPAALATASRGQSRARRHRRRAAAHRAPGQQSLIATPSIRRCSANESMRPRFSR